MAVADLHVDVYWSVRSPYSYFVTPRLFELSRRLDVSVSVKPVYPHAVRMPEMIEDRNDLWLSYFKTDIVRTAEYLGLPFAWPRPDPVAVDHNTGRLLPGQERVETLTRLIAAAEARGAGISYIYNLSNLLWSPAIEDWTADHQMDSVAMRSGLDPAELARAVADDADHYESIIQANQRQETEDGHWGVPVMVFRGEPFFGQDRFDQLMWRMCQHGLVAETRTGERR